MSIHKEALETSDSIDKLEAIPYLILHKIMTFDTRKLLTDNFNKTHPLDNLIILLHCCNNFLIQNLLTRLSTCQHAIPLLLPNPCDGSILYLLWGMREIIPAWKSTDGKGVSISKECRIVDYAAPIVSFCKIGKLELSKSQIINEVIGGESSINFFFNWECEGETVDRFFTDGLVELCCYMPSEKINFYPDMIIFTNLRGDAKRHDRQLLFMQKISFMSCVLLQENDLHDNKVVKILQELNTSPGGVIVMFTDLTNEEAPKNKMLYQQLNNDGMFMIHLKKRKLAQIRKGMREKIMERLSLYLQTHHKRLSDCVEIARSLGIQTDEDCKDSNNGKKIAEKVMEQIHLHTDTLKLFPLQGHGLWQTWAALDKEFYRQPEKEGIKTKKKDVRQKQINFISNCTPIMEAFSTTLLNQTGSMRLYFLCWLKMLLDDYSRNLNNAYKLQKTTAEEQQEDSEQKLQPTSLGLERFFREMGQMYEAVMDIQSSHVSKNLKDKVAFYPQVVADLLSEGYPIELMDGDAAHIPIIWVTAVISKLKEKYTQRQKIFVISVLGIHSTGKSTLLNHIFGLSFHASAGRCTHGAYCGLLSFDPTMQKETGCDHVLIIDSEGLRAPELYADYIEQQKHDNELATLVTGLADLTIINILGEAQGEMIDILQIAVHAFIRMKNTDMQLTCYFVHQNVLEVMADHKTKGGRLTYLKRLDDMTKKAAGVEKCGGRYKSFQDVIQFNSDKNVIFFPSLWEGNPPMASINPGYTSKASKVKKEVINFIREKRNHCDFATFKLRIKTVWYAILHESLVFSFKNILEISAYYELDAKYSEWSWKLQYEMLQCQHQAGNQIDSCNISDIHSEVKKCIEKTGQDMLSTYLKLHKELSEFFEKSESFNPILSQWYKSTEKRLKYLYEDRKAEVIQHCDIVCQNRISQKEIEKSKQKYRQQLNYYCNMFTSDADVVKCEKLFNSQWEQWINELSQKFETVVYITPDHIEKQIADVLHEKYSIHAQYMQRLEDKPLIESGTLELYITNLHLESFTSENKHVNEEDLYSAKNQTNKFFNQVKQWMEEIMKICRNFSKTFVDNLLTKLQQAIKKFNDESTSFSFTTDYQIDIAITVSRYAYQQFIAKLKELALKHNPVEAINSEKEVFLQIFRTKLTETSNDKKAAKNLSKILKKSLEKALDKKLQTEIFHDIKDNNADFKTKKNFKAKILKDLAIKKDFELYKAYLENPSASIKYWIKIYVEQYCKIRNESGKSTIYNLAKKILNELSHKIFKLEDLNSQKCFTQHIDFREWLENFHKDSNTLIVIDQEEIVEMIGVDSIHRLEFFTKQLIECLEAESKVILSEFLNTNGSIAKLIDSTNSPVVLLYNCLIGCEEKCPFCKEQCELTDKLHFGLNKTKHCVEIHRPCCLGRCINQRKKKQLNFKTCTAIVKSKATFRNCDTDNQPRNFEAYNDTYPDWDIPPNNNMETKYWEWFIAKYNTELVAWCDAERSPVDLDWKDVTEEEAINSLSMIRTD